MTVEKKRDERLNEEHATKYANMYVEIIKIPHTHTQPIFSLFILYILFYFNCGKFVVSSGSFVVVVVNVAK